MNIKKNIQIRIQVSIKQNKKNMFVKLKFLLLLDSNLGPNPDPDHCQLVFCLCSY